MDENEFTNIQFDTLLFPKRNICKSLSYSSMIFFIMSRSFSAFLLYSESTVVYINLPFKTPKPSVFISGFYAIYKNSTYNMKATEKFYNYAMANITRPASGSWPALFPPMVQWPNFDYIFDETVFGEALIIPGYQKINTPQTPKPPTTTTTTTTTTAFISTSTKNGKMAM